MLIKTTMTKPSVERMWSKWIAYSMLVNLISTTTLENSLTTYSSWGYHALWQQFHSRYTCSLEALAHTYTLRDMHKNIHSKTIWKEPKAAMNAKVHQQNQQAQCYIDTIEYYWAQKKEWTTLLPYTITWMNLTDIMSKINQTQKTLYWIILSIWNSK